MKLPANFRRSLAGPPAAFTLIELVISSALMTMIIAAGYVCLRSGLEGQKLVETRENVIQNARVAMSLISADLRLATPLSKDFEFLGMRRTLQKIDADNLDFATLNYNPRGRHEGQFSEVSYFVSQDERTGLYNLWRRRDATADPEPLKGGARELIAEGVAGLRFEYYDGWDWFDEWGDPTGKKRTSQTAQYNIEGLPEAVRITLWMESNPKPATAPELGAPLPPPGAEEEEEGEPPMVFQTTVRLNLASASNSAGSNSSSSSSTPSSSQPSPTPTGGAPQPQ